MGIVGAAVGVGSMIFGHRQQRRAEKAAMNQAREQQAHFAREEGETRRQAAGARAEYDRLSGSFRKQQNKLNKASARENRSRVKGGLFGDSPETTPGAVTSGLGR